MIALDANVLVYAHRGEAPQHDRAWEAIQELVRSRVPVAIPGPCVGEFLAVVTGGRAVTSPSTLEEALAQVEEWLRPPSVALIGERTGTWPILRGLLERSGVTGQRIHDARIAAICLDHGVRELWTVDRDFGRFPELRVRNPLVSPPAG